MRHFHQFRAAALVPLVASLLLAQVRQAPPIIFVPPAPQEPQPAPQGQPPAGQPAPQGQPAPAPGTQAGAPQPTAVPAGTAAQTNAGRLSDSGGFMLNNVSLIELVDILAKRLKINYLIDPRVKGSVSIFTYGEVKPVDLMPLLQTVLRVNGATIVKVGELYRVVPLNAVAPLPMDPQTNIDPKKLPDDERMILNLIFLKYATVGEIVKLIQPFLGEGATVTAYEPANLLLMLDNSRNMKRTMDLLALFDSDAFAGQRVRLFDVTNGRPSDLVKELEVVFKAYALSEKNAAVKFLPIDRINTIIGVAPNPGIFAEVDTWLKKLDLPVKITAGAVNNYVYRLKYGRSETVAMAIMALYGGGAGMYGLAAMMGMGMGMGGMGGGMGSMGMGGMGGYGMGGMGTGGMGGYGMGAMGGMGGYGMGGGLYSAPMYSGTAASSTPLPTTPTAPNTSANPTPDLTGSLLGAPTGQAQPQQRIPRVVPNPFDNTLLVQGTPQEWEQISRLLEQLDVPPRQVLIDAKIYEVDLKGEFSAGVTAYLQHRDDKLPSGATQAINAVSSAGGLTLSAGALVLNSHRLLGLLTSSDMTSRTKVVAAPSLIATDSIPANLNVGQEVPVLTSQAVTGGVQQSGSSLFTNTISNRSTGVTLQIVARVNSSGIVTMIINQDVSTPEAAAAGGIQSPSFQRRSVQTQVTVQDGDTIAIGGIIQESDLRSSNGVPGLHRIPWLGAAFGAKSVSKARTELIIFLTPRVIYDTNQIVEASNEIRDKLKKMKKLIRDEN